MDERLTKVREMINRGIDEVTAKPALDKEAVCIIGELIDVYKDIETIEAMKEYGYSEMSGPEYTMENYGMSGRRGGGRRRYNNNNGSYGMYENSYNNSYGNSYGNNMYNRGGYSRGGRDEMIAHLEQAMNNATSEQERENIRRVIMQYES